jgi:FlaG/FlaF family flagellin (archaellin)
MKKIFLEKRKGISQPFLVKNVDEKRKAISPLIAVILIIVVAVALIAIILNWGKSFTTSSLEDTKSIADLKVSDATHFVFNSTYRGTTLTFTYSPPSNLKNKEITIDRYTIVGSTEIYDLNTPLVLTDGYNGIVDLNLDMFTIVDKKIDVVLISTNDEYITLKNTSYSGDTSCPTCPDCEECIPFSFEGDALASQIKTGSTFYSDSNVLLTGTGTRFLSASSSVVSAGYYDANNLITIDSNLTASNIVEGVNIFGVVGTASSGPETITPLNLPYVYYPPYQTNTVLYINTVDRSGTTDWATAVSYCDTLEVHGYSDWYLPNRNQMDAIWLACPLQAKLNTCMNNNIQNKITGWSDIGVNYYWTSTEYSSSFAYRIFLLNGTIDYFNKTKDTFVRCVRDH